MHEHQTTIATQRARRIDTDPHEILPAEDIPRDASEQLFFSHTGRPVASIRFWGMGADDAPAACVGRWRPDPVHWPKWLGGSALRRAAGTGTATWLSGWSAKSSRPTQSPHWDFVAPTGRRADLGRVPRRRALVDRDHGRAILAHLGGGERGERRGHRR